MTKRWLAGSALVALTTAAFVAGGCGPSKRDVATVNGKEITQDAFEARLTQTPAAHNVMREMILEQLIHEAAEKKGIKVSDQDVDAAIQWERDRQPPNRFEETVLKGTSLDAFRPQVRAQLEARALAMQGVNVKQADVQKFYDKNLSGLFTKPEWKQVGFILAKSKDDAQKAAGLLKQGVDYLKVLQQFSADPRAKAATAANWQWFALDKGHLQSWNEQMQRREPLPPNFPPAIAAVITKLAAGKSSDAIPLSGGVAAVVKVNSDVPSGKIPLSEVQPMIAFLLASQNSQIKPVPQILQDIVKTAQIDIKLNDFQELEKPETLLGTQTPQSPAPTSAS